MNEALIHLIQVFVDKVALFVAAGLGLAVGLLLMRHRYRGHKPDICERMAEEQRDTIQDLSTRLAVADEKISRIPHLEAALEDSDRVIDALREDLKREAAEGARLEQLSRRIPELEQLLSHKADEIVGLQDTITDLKTVNRELQTRMEEERRSAKEKLALLREAEAQLSSRFENLANRILDEKSRKFTEQNKLSLDMIVTPLKEQLGDFKKKVEDVYVNDTRDRTSLREEIRHLRQQTQLINQEAVNLTRALKGDKKKQGNWGELILERVLEQSGLRRGVEYETQGGFRDEHNRVLKPDVIVRLPEGKDVVIDSKVSLAAYEVYMTAEDEGEQSAALKRHIEAVRTHIKTLGEKDYAALKGLRSLDFVLMFIPIEAAFMAAFQGDDKLFNDAFEHKIIVVTPTTLLATLRTIENIWRYERHNENAKLIAERAGAIYDKVRGLVEDLERLGKQLGTAQTTYEGVMNKLTLGNGNLIRQANSFVELGVKVKKELPKSIVTQAGGELEERTIGRTS
ncbi:MAG: DNA recombination protein RmuC [Pseudomonadota bacterium]